MRLTRLLLENYGVFERTELALSAVPGTIDLVVAPNGAGKSILRGALHDLLFGINNQSPLDFRFGYRGMAVHAEAVTASGDIFDFGWKKQGKRFFVGDPQAAEARLKTALGQTSPRQLEHLFALDTQRLREGGRELASGGDDLGVALLSGTGEMASARKLRSSLEARRHEIWEKGKFKPSLNAASRALDAARITLRDATQPPRERAAQEAAVAEAQAAAEAAAAAHRDALARSRRYDRIGRTRKPLSELAEAEAWLSAHPEAPALSPGLAPDLETARSALSLARARLQSTEAQAKRAREYAAAQQRDEAALAEEAALTQLAETIRSHEDARRDLQPTRLARDSAAASIAAILDEIGITASVEAAQAVLPTVAAVATARDLVSRHAAALSKLDDAAGRLEAAAGDLDGLRRQAVDAPDLPEDTAALAALLREIRAGGDPAVAARAAEEAARKAAAEARQALAAVPGWRGDVAALRACAPPSEAALQRHADRLAAAVTRHARQSEDHAALLAERDRLARELASLRDARVAEPARLAQVRALRDEGWRLIQQRLAGDAPDAETERAYTAGENLAVRFERHLREADAVADERATDSGRVAEAARLERELADTQALNASAAALQAEQATLAEAQTAWQTACAPIGLAGDATMAEARAFLAARDAAIRMANEAEVASEAAAALAGAQAAFVLRLARHLGPGAGESLPSALAAADRHIAAQAEAASRRQEEATALRNAQKAFDRAARDHAQAEEAMAQWHDAWAQTLTALGRPSGEAPAATAEVLLRLEELRGHVRDLADKAPRVVRMEQAIAAFEAEVGTLAARLAQAPSPDATTTARLLTARLKLAREAETRWVEAQQALRSAEKTLADAVADEEQKSQAVAALVAAIGAHTDEEADARLAASRERHCMETLRDQARASLATESEGLSHDALRADLASVELGALADARDRAVHDLETASLAQQQAAVTLSRAEQAYRDAAAATSATDAAAEHAAAVTRFGRLLEDELVLRVASDMLSRAMEAVAQNAGEGAPARISRAFASVTDGAYSVVPEDEAGRTTLRIRETAFPNEEPKAIDVLSEGTRDQLYLALRIVALEDFTAVSPPLPFIADDILQTFDDARALAALRALVELSRRVQVIVLTHHRHLAELSLGLPGGAVEIRKI